tara:strand:- start:144 stop:287 length:144 start_codon:yes stop_codon:yes gene_type:complete
MNPIALHVWHSKTFDYTDGDDCWPWTRDLFDNLWFRGWADAPKDGAD